MTVKRRFVLDYKTMTIPRITDTCVNASEKLVNNPDFEGAPVKIEDFVVGAKKLIEASAKAKRGNQAGLELFRELRVPVETMLRSLAMFAMPKIGDNEDRMLASGLALTKEPRKRPTALGAPTDVTLKKGPGIGMLEATAKLERAADGIEAQISFDNKETWSQPYFTVGHILSLPGLPSGKLVYGRVRYWNKLYRGEWNTGELLAIVP